MVGQFLGQGHGHLTRAGHRTGTAFGQQIGDLDLVVLGHGALDVIHTHQFVLQREEILERFTNQLNGDVASHEVRMSDDALQSTFKFTDVGANTLGNKESSVMRQVYLGLVCLLHQDRDTGFQFRRLDRDGQAPAEARFQTLFQPFNLFRITVTGQDYLLTAFEQGVEGVEKLFLGTLFTGEELNVIDEQRIHRTVEALELVDGIELQRLDHVRDETLGMQVDHLGIRILLEQVVTHSMHQVCFTQTYAAIKEQRVVAMLGIVGDLPGGCASQLVGLTFDEVLEGKGTVQVAGVLERTFDLHGTLLGTTAWRRRISGFAHGIEAVTRRRLLDFSRSRSNNRCGNGFVDHGSLCSLRLGCGNSGSQWCVRGGTRRRTASAAY
ncbi:hypothetical protein D3C79_652520 [compost metagenome]